MYYPNNGEIQGATYIEEVPDLSKYGKPAFGWVDSPTNIVLRFSYSYNEGCKEKVDAIIDKVIEYNKENGMFDGTVLTNYRFNHIENGYEAIEVFVNAEGASRYYEKFQQCPFIEEMMSMAGMIQQNKPGEIIALAEERNKCASIGEFYPNNGEVTGNIYIEEVPDLSKYGKPAFGWV